MKKHVITDARVNEKLNHLAQCAGRIKESYHEVETIRLGALMPYNSSAHQYWRRKELEWAGVIEFDWPTGGEWVSLVVEKQGKFFDAIGRKPDDPPYHPNCGCAIPPLK